MTDTTDIYLPKNARADTKPAKRVDAFKMTDFRRELTFREKKVAEIKREKMRTLADMKPVPRYMITVDLSHARGNMDVLKLCLKDLEWKEYPFGRKDQNCDFHWHCINFEQNPDLYGGRVNKFPGMSWICSKNNLFRVLDQMRALYPDQYNFFPRTWYLPEQLTVLAHEIRIRNEKKTRPRPTFIVKPDTGSQGEGIYLIRDIPDFQPNPGRRHVCQEYLTDVLLIDKFKFDLRVYAVLKSVEPLEIHVCKEGLARFSTVPYEYPTHKNLHETFMHLTNYSLNKRSSTFNKSERDDEGSKRTMSSVFNRLRRYGYDVDKLWQRIERIIVKTTLAIIPDLRIEMMSTLPPNKPGPTCFQILGFDILLMKNLKPMLLEINGSPSLRTDSEIEVAPGIVEYVPSAKDEEVKVPLIRDTLLLMAPKNKLKYLQSQKRRRMRQERRRHRREEEQRVQQELDEKRLPTQTEKDGVIHVETNHPRSSIIIIRADEEETKKKQNESSFAIPNMASSSDPSNNETGLLNENMNKNYTNDEVTNSNNNNANNNVEETLDKLQETLTDNYNVRTEFVDLDPDSKDIKLEDDESGHGPSSGSRRYRKKSSKRKKLEEVAMEIGDDGNQDNQDSNSEDEGHELDDCGSCLKQLYPDPYEDKFENLRLYEKLAEVFMLCLGVRATQRLGPTGFRTFARKCRLNKRGLTNAAIDILYIDMQRRWEHVNPERTTGLGFRGFLEACHEIARRKFSCDDPLETMEEFICYCEENLHEDQLQQMKNMPRLLARRGMRPHGYPLLAPMPPSSPSPMIDEQTGILLDSRMEQYLMPKSAEDVDLFLRRHGKLASIKHTRSGRRIKSSKELSDG